MYKFARKYIPEMLVCVELYGECDWLRKLFGGETNTGSCENTSVCGQGKNIMICSKE